MPIQPSVLLFNTYSTTPRIPASLALSIPFGSKQNLTGRRLQKPSLLRGLGKPRGKWKGMEEEVEKSSKPHHLAHFSRKLIHPADKTGIFASLSL